ncbi:MAG: hypothetical protein ABI411_19965 [Tahibacter sp.]
MLLTSLLLALSLSDALPLPADHILNPDFDPAFRAANWQFHLDGGTHGHVDWDATVGSPGLGSAKASSVWHDAGKDGWSQCITLPAGPFMVNVAVASNLLAGNRCELRVAVVNQNNCNIMAGIVVDLNAQNALNDGTFETLGVSGIVPAGAGAAAIYLSHVRSATAAIGDSTCYFDHVQLNGDPLFVAGFD